MKFTKKQDNASKRSKFMRSLFTIAAFVAIFALGLGIGNGAINNGNNSDLASVAEDLPNNLNYNEVEEIYDSLRSNFDGELTEQELLEGLKEGLVNATGDQYTQYLSPEEAKEFSADLNGTFSGIGARLMQNENDLVMVETPLAGYPAEKAGLRARDVIAEIDGKSALELTVNEAVEKIRGKAGTNVKLKIVRDNKQELDFEIKRETITVPSVEYEIMTGNTGYIQVARFDETTFTRAQKAADDMKAAGVKGIILDLRNNPGGILDAAVDLSGIWLPRGKVVLQEKRDNIVVKTFESHGPATLAGIKTVILINEGSASASEITAGALHDNGVATLMGEKSFGKGSVQTLQELPNGGLLKVTIARWFTPKGKNIDKEGIEPDKKVERTIEDIENDRDPQKNEAVKFLQN